MKREEFSLITERTVHLRLQKARTIKKRKGGTKPINKGREGGATNGTIALGPTSHTSASTSASSSISITWLPSAGV